jgi:hypothetical protein
MIGWRELHNQEFHDLYPTPYYIRMRKLMRMKWTRHVARMVKVGHECKDLVGRRKGVRYSRIWGRWEDNIKIDHGEIGRIMLIVFIWFRIGAFGGLL